MSELNNETFMWYSWGGTRLQTNICEYNLSVPFDPNSAVPIVTAEERVTQFVLDALTGKIK